MEHHVLYTTQRRDVALQCAAFHHLGYLPCDATAEHAAGLSAVRDTHAPTNNRQPRCGEALHGVLYVGDSHGTLSVLRLRAELPEDDSTSYKLGITPCALSVALAGTSTRRAAASAQASTLPASTGSIRDSSGGVTFLAVSAALQLLFALVDGRMHVLRLGVTPLAASMTMQEQMHYFATCASWPAIAAHTTLLCCMAKEQVNDTEAGATHTDQAPPCRLALVLDDYRLVLLQCNEMAAQDLASGSDAHDTAALPMVPAGTCVMEWCRHVLLVGTPTQYCLYDVRSWRVLSRLDLVVPLLGGPMVRHLSPCCPPSSTTATVTTGWPSSLLFRTAAEELWMYDLDRLTSTASASAARPFHMTDDEAAPSVCDVLSVPPFCLGCSSAGTLSLRSCFDARAWHVPQCQLRGCGLGNTATMPLGLLYCAPLEATQTQAVQLWAVPTPAVHCRHLVQGGAYDAALRCLTWYQQRQAADGEAALSAEQGTGEGSRAAQHKAAQHTLYEACAIHAMQTAHYEDAFRFFAQTGSTSHTMLHCFPELRLLLPPSQAQGQSSATQMHTALESFRRSYDSDIPYRRLYACLMRRVIARALRERHENDDDDENGDDDDDNDDDDAHAALATPEMHSDGEKEEEEVALFTLIAMNESMLCRVGCTADERDAFFVVARHLHRDLGVACVDPHGPFAQPSLALLVLACTGAFEAALTQCEERGAVHEAGVVLRMHSHRYGWRRRVPHKDDGAHKEDNALYCRHLPWMLTKDTAEAMRVVLTPQPHPPSPYELLPILLGHSCETVFHYLHYILHSRHYGSAASEAPTQDATLHTLHALNLVDMIAQLRHIVGADTSSQLPRRPAGHELGPLGYLRHTLLAFLRESRLYDGWSVLAQLQRHDLAEEQVVVLRRMNDTVGALQVLVYKLNDLDAAVQLCRSAAHAPALLSDEGNDHSDISECMELGDVGPSDASLQRTSEPNSGCDDDENDSAQRGTGEMGLYLLLYVLMVPPSDTHKPRLRTALRLLHTHAHALDPQAVLRALPDDVAMRDLVSYLVCATQLASTRAQLADAEFAAVHCLVREAVRRHTTLQRRCVVVDSSCRCAVCHTPLQSAAMLTVFPNLKYAHVKCCASNTLDPERDVPFRNWFAQRRVSPVLPSHDRGKVAHA